MYQGTKIVQCTTRVNKDAPEHVTEVTFDFAGVTEEQVVGAAIRQMIVDLQNGWRKNGIPPKTTVKVAELGTGRRARTVVRPMTPAEMIEAMKSGEISQEQRAALMEMLGVRNK